MDVKLRRAQLKKGVEGLDITVKLAVGNARWFAPAWSMVTQHKNGTMSDEEYTEMYFKMLNNVPENIWKWLYNKGVENNGEITLLCFCKDDTNFCHTFLLADYASSNVKGFINATKEINEFTG